MLFTQKWFLSHWQWTNWLVRAIENLSVCCRSFNKTSRTYGASQICWTQPFLSLLLGLLESQRWLAERGHVILAKEVAEKRLRRRPLISWDRRRLRSRPERANSLTFNSNTTSVFQLRCGKKKALYPHGNREGAKGTLKWTFMFLTWISLANILINSGWMAKSHLIDNFL